MKPLSFNRIEWSDQFVNNSLFFFFFFPNKNIKIKPYIERVIWQRREGKSENIYMRTRSLYTHVACNFLENCTSLHCRVGVGNKENKEVCRFQMA